MAHFVMTDKAETKTVQCGFAGCEHTVAVTKFFTPSKARCPEHQGQASSAIRKMVTADPSSSPDLTPPTPNTSLQDVRCLFDNTSLTIKRVDDKMGWITFECPQCYSAFEVKPRWAPLIMSAVPKHLQSIVNEFNNVQREAEASVGRDMVGHFKSTSDGHGDATWIPYVRGLRNEEFPDLLLDATGFKFGTVVQIYEPTEGDMPKERVEEETKPNA